MLLLVATSRGMCGRWCRLKIISGRGFRMHINNGYSLCISVVISAFENVEWEHPHRIACFDRE